MHEISVYRRRDDGKLAVVREFQSFDELFKELGYLNANDFRNVFDTDFNVRRLVRPFSWDNLPDRRLEPQGAVVFHRDWTYVVHPYVVANYRDRIISVDQLLGMYRAYRKKHYGKTTPKFMIAQLRNPGHKSSYHRGTYYRRMRTTQEMKWAHAWDDEEFAPACRLSRNYKNLPNAWDDYVRLDWRNKNWKRHRAHQWKQKKGDR